MQSTTDRDRKYGAKLADELETARQELRVADHFSHGVEKFTICTEQESTRRDRDKCYARGLALRSWEELRDDSAVSKTNSFTGLPNCEN